MSNKADHDGDDHIRRILSPDTEFYRSASILPMLNGSMVSSTSRRAGYAKAARTEIGRAALQELQHVLTGRTRAEIVRFFLDREPQRLLASF